MEQDINGVNSQNDAGIDTSINDIVREISRTVNMFQLIAFRKQTFPEDKEERHAIENRMIYILKEELPRVNNIYHLIFYWMNTDYASESSRLIECRLSEIFEAELLKINDMEEVMRLFTYFKDHVLFARMCRKRISVSISEVKKDNLPNWFTYYMQNPDKIKNHRR